MLKQCTQWGCSYVWAPASTQTCKLAQFMLMQSHKSTKMKARACVPPNPAQKGNTPPAPPDVHVLVQGVHRLCGCFTLSLFCIPADFHTLGVIPGRVIVIQITSDTKSINNRWRIKAIFSRHGIPTTLQSDTGPQFDSSEFQHFAEECNFTRTSNSFHYSYRNNFVKWGVKTEDPYLAMVNYRAALQCWCRCSPTELLMGRKVRTTLPQTIQQLISDWQFFDEFREREV